MQLHEALQAESTSLLLMTGLIARLIVSPNGLTQVTPLTSRLQAKLQVVTKSDEPSSTNFNPPSTNLFRPLKGMPILSCSPSSQELPKVLNLEICLKSYRDIPSLKKLEALGLTTSHESFHYYKKTLAWPLYRPISPSKDPSKGNLGVS